MKKQMVWIPFDGSVFWRNPGQFLAISDPITRAPVVIRRSHITTEHQVQVRVIESRPGITDGPSLERISFLMPQNAHFWGDAVNPRITTFRKFFKNFYAESEIEALILKLPNPSISPMNDGDKWIILCSLILSEIQPRLSRRDGIYSCPVGKFLPRDNYFAFLLVFFLIRLDRIALPSNVDRWARSKQYYHITDYFMERFMSGGGLHARYIASYSPCRSTAEFLQKHLNIPEAITLSFS